MVDIKLVHSTERHREYNDAMKEVLLRFYDDLSPIEMLAITAHLTGILLAMQDQRKITPEMAMELVIRNIEGGNAEAIKGLRMARQQGNA